MIDHNKENNALKNQQIFIKLLSPPWLLPVWTAKTCASPARFLTVCLFVSSLWFVLGFAVVYFISCIGAAHYRCLEA